MTNMKSSDEEKAEYSNTVMCGQPVYPYGLRICLDDDAIEKLGIGKLPEIDQVMEIKCKVQVIGVRSNKMSDEDNEDSIDLQITDMEITGSGDKSTAEKLYGG